MADMTAYEKWRRKRAGLDGTDILLRSGSGFQIVPEIDVAPEDIIVDKTCNGAFTYTDLELVLRAQGITHLLFSGCTTDVCVHTTLREACDRNFQCLTISDACASGDRYAHEAAHGHRRERRLWCTGRRECRYRRLVASRRQGRPKRLRGGLTPPRECPAQRGIQKSQAAPPRPRAAPSYCRAASPFPGPP